ncbi:MAG TPA: hypothetical protein VHD87_14070 [Acidimicrobiales bacterium]|nr:hypothetical protein [Acidimicrobiales bacterium]
MRPALVSIGATALVAAACSDPAVRLSYRPKVGTRTSYELRVTTTSHTRLVGQPPKDRHDSFVLRSDQLVRQARFGATRVAVRLSGAGQKPRDFIVRLDRAGQLTTVESEGGVARSELGNPDLGISELLPSAAGALPRDALRPGDRWRISQRLRSSSLPEGVLVGFGRLASLGVSHGTKLAVVDTDVALPVDLTTQQDVGAIHLVGTQRTTMHVVQRVRDGVVVQARAHTVGHYAVTLSPPVDLTAPPVTGTLTVTVSSTTRAR